MVTGITGANMTANVMGASVPTPLKDANLSNGATVAPVKSDRRSNKPIMEKRRRARINNCLNELKTLILDATKKDPARHSKLEKADILEKTVKHLQELQRQQAAMQQAADPKVLNKFRAGFADCANEVNRFPGLDQAAKRRLLQHLSNCINTMKTEVHQHQRQVIAAAAAAAAASTHSAQILPSPPSSPEQADHHMQQQQQQQQHHQQMLGNHTGAYTQIQHTVHGYILPNGMHVIPTKLPNGSIAFVLPQSLPQQQQQQPPKQQQHLLIPSQQQQQHQHLTVPTRTASTSSASSHSSSSGYERLMASPNNGVQYAPPSPANSYEAMDCKPSVIQHASVYAQQLQHQHQHHQLQQQQQQQHHHQEQQQMQLQSQQPLSLVIKKHIKEEEQPWRPW